MNQQLPSYGGQSDPYVYQAFQSLIGMDVVVQTIRGTVTGKLQRALPDHIVVESGCSPFLIRTQQIIWVIPRG